MADGFGGPAQAGSADRYFQLGSVATPVLTASLGASFMHDDTVGRPMEILLVEDSLTHARLAIGALRNSDVEHRLTLVRDGQEAIDFLNRCGIFARAPRPDLILLDLFMPKKDGFQVLDEIRQDVELTMIPIVVMTASESSDDMERCRYLGIEHYMTKPVELDKFLLLIRELKSYWKNDLVLPFMD
jgi:two-component system, chemotaxis family, response regulator Rcp1